jgi:hypothetical protein
VPPRRAIAPPIGGHRYRRRNRCPAIAPAHAKQWYRTLDQLLERKDAIERPLYLRLRDLFSLRTDIVFYDLTSTYFEGKGPLVIGAYGHSRDGKPRNPQVLVGLLLVDGWPIAHHCSKATSAMP